MRFNAVPPAPVWPTTKLAKALARQALRYVWQPLVPFEVGARLDAEFPTGALGTSQESHLEFSEKIFDTAEERRSQLEQKAQWTFAAIGLVTPSLASIVVFVLNDTSSAPGARALPIGLLIGSGSLMLLSYLSAARALWVGAKEVLHLGAVVDTETGEFLPYEAAERARGYLYCASMNTAYNDHVAQFVRGAQALGAASIILFSVGAISTVLQRSASRAAIIRIDLGDREEEDRRLATLSEAINRLALTNREERLSVSDAATAAARSLEARVDRLEAVPRTPPEISLPRAPAPTRIARTRRAPRILEPRPHRGATSGAASPRGAVAIH